MFGFVLFGENKGHSKIIEKPGGFTRNTHFFIFRGTGKELQRMSIFWSLVQRKKSVGLSNRHRVFVSRGNII